MTQLNQETFANTRQETGLQSIFRLEAVTAVYGTRHEMVRLTLNEGILGVLIMFLC